MMQVFYTIHCEVGLPRVSNKTAGDALVRPGASTPAVMLLATFDRNIPVAAPQELWNCMRKEHIASSLICFISNWISKKCRINNLLLT